jgi:ankyrin repeat protein
MLAAGLPPDALGQHNATPLHWAAFHGNVDMLREILGYNPPLNTTDTDFQSTPLGWAIHGSVHGWYCATGDYPTVVRLLLDAGANPPHVITGGSDAVQTVLRQHGPRD